MRGGADGAVPRPRRTLIGGVGYRWQRDASFGLVAADALAAQTWPDSVAVEDLGYGALFVAEDLAAADPPYERLILLSAAARGRRPGRVYRYAARPRTADADEVQARIREAGAGVIDLEHLLVIARHFGALPPDVVVYEAEPVETDGGEALGPALAAALEPVLAAVRADALGGVEEVGAEIGAGEFEGAAALPAVERRDPDAARAALATDEARRHAGETEA